MRNKHKHFIKIGSAVKKKFSHIHREREDLYIFYKDNKYLNIYGINCVMQIFLPVNV